MYIPQGNRKNVTLLVETPRGRTAATSLSPTLAYDSFVQHVWEAARMRDEDPGRKRSRSIDEEYKSRNVRRNTFAVHNGKVVNQDNFQSLLQSHDGCSNQMQTVSLRLRLRGGIDRQNRVGSKFGGGGVSSSQNAERERKERLKQLALESIELSKDPYLMKNHLGTYECKLCLTLHTNEANYLAHTQGKKHQAGLARRAHMEKLREKEQQAQSMPSAVSTLKPAAVVTRKVRIGRPAYQVYKSRDPETNQRCLSFELNYPEIASDIQPRHRFMSAYEQRVDTPPDRRFQYLLFAADPYETVAFKIPNEPVDKGEGRFVTHWDAEDKKFILTLYFMDPEEEKKD